ncbi:MAG: mechanosensitive ion channel domain-containing protein [Acholeplasmataceae bacterium]
MDYIREKIIDILLNLKLELKIAEIASDLLLFIILIIISLFIYLLIKLIFNQTIKKVALKSKNLFIKAFFENKLILNLFKLIPVLIIQVMLKYMPSIIDFTQALLMVVITFLFVKIINTTLDLINTVYEKNHQQAGIRPIKGLINFIKAIVVTIALIIVIANLIGQSPLAILTGLGAMSAVLMLIFKDSILGLVAGFQMSANDLIRLGDWIELKKYDVDGQVVDVTLTFIKVKNWDNTIVTIPAYLLISDSFVNWRNVFKEGGRRIKRSINIDLESVKFCGEDLYNRLLEIEKIKPYLIERELEIKEYNQKHNINVDIPINGRRMTNLGIFRKYLTEYIKSNQNINQNMTILVRQLQTNNKGIPLEVYAFSNETSIIKYEAVQADIFDHIYASINYFDLKLYQEPSGNDFKNR